MHCFLMFFVGVLGKEGYVHVAGDALFCYIEFKQFDPNAIESTFHLYIHIHIYTCKSQKNVFLIMGICLVSFICCFFAFGGAGIDM